MDELRVPPQNLDAERSVLGCCILVNEAIDSAVDVLDSRHFYSEKHQRIWSAMVALRDKRKPVDAVTLAEELERRKQLAEIGGIEYLAKIMDTVPHAAHVRHYADIVREKSVLRGLITVCTDAIRSAYDSTTATADTVARAQAGILGVEVGGREDEPTAIGDIFLDVLENLGKPQRSRTVSTTFERVDQMCGGYPLGGLTIIGARPSMGKTSFVLASAVRLGEVGVPVLLVVYEQRRIEITERMLAIYTNTSFFRMSRGQTTAQENAEIVRYACQLDKAPVFVDDTQRSQSRLMAIIRGMVRRHGIKLVVVDYIGLVPVDDSRLVREQQISSLSRGFKNIAGELNIAMVVLSQLNRLADIQNRKPRLSDLRESGSLEQDADVVMFLHRQNFDTTDPQKYPDDNGLLIVAKQRNGPRGEIPLEWVPESMSYRNVTDSYRAECIIGGTPVTEVEDF